MQEFISKIFSHQRTGHTFFCMVVLLLFVIGIIINSRRVTTVAPRGLLVYLFFLTCVYSGRWLFKRWLETKQYIIQLLLSTILCITVLTFVCTIGISLIFHPINFDIYDYFLMSFVPVILFLFIGIFITIIHKTFLQQIQNAHIAEQQKQSELNLLQSQLSPHFLFNTLNNLSALTVPKD
ncbi:MAG: histidine kinase [Segetibacter sp.]